MANPPGPLCTTKLGPDWNDQGTNSRTRNRASGPLGIFIELTLSATPADPFRAKFDADHVYSSAPEAITKRAIDLSIIGGDYRRGDEVRIDNEAYLKRLIEIASGGKYSVGPTSNFQFFIVRGGAEGFLPLSLRGTDASNVVLPGAATSGVSSLTFRFDNNDLLIVFDSSANLVSSARLERPLFITGIWTQKTANKIYDNWADKEVFIYKNSNFDIPYLGLGVKDDFRGKGATVDMHKQEATNGCIFIVDDDPTRPAMGDDVNLAKFEPKLIRDILAKAGISLASVTAKQVSLGVMRVVEIR